MRKGESSDDDHDESYIEINHTSRLTVHLYCYFSCCYLFMTNRFVDLLFLEAVVILIYTYI